MADLEDYPSVRYDGPQNGSISHDDILPNGTTAYARAMRSLDTVDTAYSIGSPPANSPPLLRTSAESYTEDHAESSTHLGSSEMTKDTASTLISEPNNSNNLVDGNFDEAVLRSLCELDCGVPLLLDRIKQGMASCREASIFFKKRALIEDEYGKTMQKTSRAAAELYGQSDGKAGTFVNAWKGSLKIHDTMGDNRLRFANRLNEMSEELATLAKEVDKNRKQTKELASRYERALQESELIVDKNKNRLDSTTEELERLLLQKEGESLKDNALQGRSPGSAAGKRVIGKAVAKGGMLLKGKNPGNLHRQEEDIRARMSVASDSYRKSVLDTQSMRQEYFNFQLPRILRALKECADEIDLATQYHLTRYAFLFESIVLSDGSTLVPTASDSASLGLKGIIESIDNRTDFRNYMQNYAFARGGNHNVRVLRREGPTDEGFLPPIPLANSYTNSTVTSPTSAAPPLPLPLPLPSLPPTTPGAVPPTTPDKGRPTFGVDLSEQMIRDNVDVPPILEKCCEAIEKHGLDIQGIYRLSGTTSKVQQLKQRLDRDLESVDLDDPEWTSDINNVASVLKMWLRELPDPLMTFTLQQGFIEAARIDNDRLRHIRLHERVNELPDPNYSTLKYLLAHLHRVNENEAANSMTAQNLSIVFGPTLFGGMSAHPAAVNGNGVADATAYQNIAIETVLKHYTDIFVDDAE